MTKNMEIIIPIVTCLLGAIAGGVATNLNNRAQRINLEKKAKENKEKAEENKRKAFYQQMQLHLTGSKAAFMNQVIARDRLVNLIEKNHGSSSTRELEYEPLFRKFYPVLNEDEKVLFELIRGITTTSLHKHNSGMLTLLEKNSEYMDELPEFKALHEHLDLWLSKYNAMVKKREDFCLVYIGVEEKKPFPSGIDEKVSEVLDKIEHGS
jgi:hypothetical protein